MCNKIRASNKSIYARYLVLYTQTLTTYLNVTYLRALLFSLPPPFFHYIHSIYPYLLFLPLLSLFFF